eukprot:6097682-Alexandrium_andersonii.AAC.1
MGPPVEDPPVAQTDRGQRPRIPSVALSGQWPVCTRAAYSRAYTMEHACRRARALLTCSIRAMPNALPARFMPARTRTGC